MDNRLSLFISAMPVASVESFSNDGNEHGKKAKAASTRIRYYWKLNRISFDTNRPYVHLKPVNPLTETASSLNRFPEWFKPPVRRIRLKRKVLWKMSGFVWTGGLLIDKRKKTLHVHAFLYPHYFAVVARPRLEHTRQRFLTRAEFLFCLLTLLLCWFSRCRGLLRYLSSLITFNKLMGKNLPPRTDSGLVQTLNFSWGEPNSN